MANEFIDKAMAIIAEIAEKFLELIFLLGPSHPAQEHFEEIGRKLLRISAQVTYHPRPHTSSVNQSLAWQASTAAEIFKSLLKH